MSNFTKLHANIITSSLWTNEDDATRLLWVTMLALADAQGRVIASVPGLAHIARVTVPKAVEALEKFKAPDQWSRSKEHEGRRIVEIEDGWRLLNYDKYREARDPEERRKQVREAVQRHRERTRNHPVIQGKPQKAQAEEEGEAEAEGEGEAEPNVRSNVCVDRSALSGSASPAPDDAPISPSDSVRSSTKAERMEKARPLLRWLNSQAGRSFRDTPNNMLLIAARLDEVNGDMEGIKRMIVRQCARWKDDPKMAEYLRPDTLFGKEKFGTYYDDRDQPVGNPRGLRGTSTPSDAEF